ncbi:hypothetical protein K1W54_25240 [Micromonospora sp. CPCC 205371]|nr:hypothetical protein [Micromonospora sp. CPCC 205371]
MSLIFAEAERRSPYALLLELHEHALLSTDDAGGHLTELALAAAVVSWWTRWQPLTVYRALLSGATLAEVAAACGLDRAEVARRWTRWAEAQMRLVIGSRPALDPAEAEFVRGRIEAEMVA